MSTTTTNYGLTKPDESDFYDIDIHNGNADIVDTQMKTNADAVASAAAKAGYYGTCATAAATTAKAVTCSGFVLEAGAHILVAFTSANTATTATLSVNSTTAAAVYCNGSSTITGRIPTFALLEYDGTYWQLLNPLSYSGTTSGVPVFTTTNGALTTKTALAALAALGEGYGTCATAAATAAKVVPLASFALVVGGIIGVSFTYQNTAASPSVNVNSTGALAVYCNGAVAVSGQIPLRAIFMYDGTYWQLLNPAETPTSEGALINGATEKTTPVDADYVGIMDSAASNVLKKLSWANIKDAVRNIVLTGLSTTTSAVITATDTVLTAFGKLQAQITAHKADYTRCPGYAVDTGVADAYVVTLTPAPTAYVDGMTLIVRILNTNTGESTINVNGLGAISIKSESSPWTLRAGDLYANGTYLLVYTSAANQFRLVGGNEDAFKLQGMVPDASATVNTIAQRDSVGVMAAAAIELTYSFIDFHYQDDALDYAVRMQTSATNKLNIFASDNNATPLAINGNAVWHTGNDDALMGSGTALPASSGTMTVTMDGSVKALQPTGACTLNASGGTEGQKCSICIYTVSSTSNTITFGTNFKSAGTLSTGTTAAKYFVVNFVYAWGTWIETGRTAAM